MTIVLFYKKTIILAEINFLKVLMSLFVEVLHRHLRFIFNYWEGPNNLSRFFCFVSITEPGHDLWRIIKFMREY